jgi:hypothetical protein
MLFYSPSYDKYIQLFYKYIMKMSLLLIKFSKNKRSVERAQLWLFNTKVVMQFIRISKKFTTD